MYNILIVDDYPSVMEGTKAMLEQEGDITVLTADSKEQALETIRKQSFDMLLVGLNMPDIDLFEFVKQLINFDPASTILLYSGNDIKMNFNLFAEAGLSGFIPKTASKTKLITAIRCALNGDSVIPISLFRELRNRADALSGGDYTVRNSNDVSINVKELTILKNLAQGKSNQEIAMLLATGQRTLEYALTQLYHKLKVKSRKEAVAKSKELGLLIAGDFL
jgi:two-component system competent response regulator ComA